MNLPQAAYASERFGEDPPNADLRGTGSLHAVAEKFDAEETDSDDTSARGWDGCLHILDVHRS